MFLFFKVCILFSNNHPFGTIFQYSSFIVYFLRFYPPLLPPLDEPEPREPPLDEPELREPPLEDLETPELEEPELLLGVYVELFDDDLELLLLVDGV
jgi:hypothetical protein